MKSVFQVIITLIICIILMEITLNYTEIILPTFVITDPEKGDVLEPGADVAYFAEGFAMNEVNPAGYWGTLYQTARTPNTIRIALIGDSYVEALQVQSEHHFGVIIEKKLGELSGKKVEVLNFGRSGLSFREMFRTYEFDVKKYNPDFILFFVQDQDFLMKGPEIGPQVFLNDNNEIEFTDFDESSLYKSRERWEEIKQFSSYSLLRNVVKMVKSGKSDEILLDKLDFIYTEEELMQNDSLMNNQRDVFLKINQAIYKKLKSDESRFNNKNLTITIESMPENYDKIIRNYSTLIDLQPPLEMFKDTSGIDPIYWEVTNTRGHWNYEGHKFVGEYLAKKIAEILNINEKISGVETKDASILSH
jgi:hypothetical protein